MYKPVIHANFDFKFDYTFDKPVEIWIDNFNRPLVKDAKKIFIRMEPEEILPYNYGVILNNKFYDHILTFEENLLSFKNSSLFEFGTTWIDFKNYPYKDKTFSTSFVCGNKLQTIGHRIRQDIWSVKERINTPIDFYGSSHNAGPKWMKILNDLKNPLFDSMFHICVENSCKRYYFSEKLIDAFITKTIPIYWGCYEIANYFNTSGFFQFRNANDVVSICNTLTEEDYYKRLDQVEENYQKALNWVDYPQRLFNKVNELI